jgi:chitodextrinase
VDARDAAGNVSAAGTTTVTTAACAPVADKQAPSVPTGPAGSSTSRTALTLGWNASGDNVGVTGYDVYLNGTMLTTTTALTYKFGGLACGTTYTLGVDAYDASGNHSAIASTTAATKSCLKSPGSTLAPPTGLTAAGTSKTAVNLGWQPSADAGSISGYGVYLNGTFLKTAGANATTARIANLNCGTTYTVGVDAYDANGNRSSITSTTATTFACAAATKKYSTRR